MSLVGVSGIRAYSEREKPRLWAIGIPGGTSDSEVLKHILTFDTLKKEDVSSVDSDGDTTLHAAIFAYFIASRGIVPTLSKTGMLLAKLSPWIAVASLPSQDDRDLTFSRLLAANLLCRSIRRIGSVVDSRIYQNMSSSFANIITALDGGIAFDVPNKEGITPFMLVASVPTRNAQTISGPLFLLCREVVRQGPAAPLLRSIAEMRDTKNRSALDHVRRAGSLVNKYSPRLLFFGACLEKKFENAFAFAKQFIDGVVVDDLISTDVEGECDDD